MASSVLRRPVHLLPSSLPPLSFSFLSFLLLTIILLALLITPAVAISITEIMYDPPGNDNNLEYIEVADAPELTGWTIADIASSDVLVPLRLNASNGYALIVEEGFNHSGLGCNIYGAGATIGNNLNNDADMIRLLGPDGAAVAAFAYNATVADGNGYALALFNGSWGESAAIGGSPCRPNPAPSEDQEPPVDPSNGTAAYDLSLTSILPQTIYAGIPYEGLFRVENERYVSGRSGYVNATVRYLLWEGGDTAADGRALPPGTEPLLNDTFTVIFRSYKTAGTGALTADAEGNYTLCGAIIAANVTDEEPGNDATCIPLLAVDPYAEPCNVTLSLLLDEERLYYEEGERIPFFNRPIRHDNGTMPPYIIRYAITELSGRVIALKTTENDRQKSFTPRIDGEVGVFLLTNGFDMLACNNTPGATGKAIGETRLVVVHGGSAEPLRSAVEIVDLGVPKEGYRFGDELRVAVHVAKGNTTKYAVKLWAEELDGTKVSSVTTLHAKERERVYDLVLPVRLKPLPKGGLHRVVLEGLGSRDTAQLWIGPPASGAAPVAVFSIASFGTRARKAQERITLAATINGEGNATLLLIGLHGHARRNVTLDGAHSYTEEVAMAPGPNVFLLRVQRDGKTLAERPLLLEMGDAIEEVAWFSDEEPEATPPPLQREGVAAPDDAPLPAEESPAATPTGAVVFEKEQPSRALPLLFGLAGAALLVIILKERL